MKIAYSAQKAPRLVTVYAIKLPWSAAQLRKTALTGALFQPEKLRWKSDSLREAFY